jgi:hypothetical protein
MQVRALRPFSLGGGRDVYLGDVFELDPWRAQEKIRAGWVEAVTQPAAVPAVDPEHVQQRDPEPTARDPRIATRRAR